MTTDAPRGLVGLRSHKPVGVAVTVGIKAAKTGQPILKDRFFMMSPDATLGEFQGGNRPFRSPVRTPHPDFMAWNQKAKEGPSGVSSFRGNFVHADWREAARWSRSAHKLPEPNPNPSSLRPACEGNGVEAKRYRGLKDGEELFEKIACPNDLCQFAMEQPGGRPALCKPFASLIFRLRWNQDDPFERQFPGMLTKWSTRGWHAASGLIGLLEMILGTEAVSPSTPRDEWTPGLAADLGIANPSMVGFPFSAVLISKSTDGKVYPVVRFSPDSDPVQWLLNQQRQRLELSGKTTLSLGTAPATVNDPDYVDHARHMDRADLDCAIIEAEPAPPAEKAAVVILDASGNQRTVELAVDALPPEALAGDEDPVTEALTPDQQTRVKREAQSLGVDLADIENAYGYALHGITVEGKNSEALLADILQEIQRRARLRKGKR